MARIDPQYQPQQAGLQAVSAPDLQTQRARFDPNDSGAFQLAKALGALPVEQVNTQIRAVADAQFHEDRQAAQEFFNKNGMDVVKKMIDDKSIMAIQSPAFNAALQHIYGENLQAQQVRDMHSDLASGKLKLNTDAEVQDYMTKMRNEALTGQSQYAIAGYDKHYANSLGTTLDTNRKIIDHEARQRAMVEGSDAMANEALRVTAQDYKGDAVGGLLAKYKLLRDTSLFNNETATKVLMQTVESIASSGNTDLVRKLLDGKLDNGATVKATITLPEADRLFHHAEVVNDKNNHLRVQSEMRPFMDSADTGKLDLKGFNEWARTNERWLPPGTEHSIRSMNQSAIDRLQRENDRAALIAAAEKSVSLAKAGVDAAVRSNAYGTYTAGPVLTTTGEWKKFDSDSAAVESAKALIQEQGLTESKATRVWSMNNIVDPEAQKQLQAGVANIASVSFGVDGKPIGQLSDAGKAAIDRFIVINKTDPKYAKKLMANPEDYAVMSDIQLLMDHGGYPNPNDAASMVNLSRKSGIEKGDYGKGLIKKVHDAVDGVVNPNWYSGRAAWFNGLFGNDEVNLQPIAADLRRQTELMVTTGMYKDADTALKAVATYMAKPEVTTKVNNTVYFTKDLPTVPPKEDPAEWFGRFIKDVPERLAKDQKMSGDVRLQPDQDGNYRAFIGSYPLTDQNGQMQVYTPDQVSQWISGAVSGEQAKAMNQRNYELWKAGELKKLGAEMKKVGASNTAFGQPLGIDSHMYSIERYNQLVREGKVTIPTQADPSIPVAPKKKPLDIPKVHPTKGFPLN